MGARASDDVTIEASRDGIRVAELIDMAARIEHEAFFYWPQDLVEAWVPLYGSVVVPRDRFLEFFDACLRDADFVHVEHEVAGQRMHSIRKLGQQAHGQQALKGDAPIVAPEELPKLDGRCTLVTSWVLCGSSDAARSIACPALCQFFTVNAIAAIRSIQGTGVILMTGLSPNVAKYSAMAKELDALPRRGKRPAAR